MKIRHEIILYLCMTFRHKVSWCPWNVWQNWQKITLNVIHISQLQSGPLTTISCGIQVHVLESELPLVSHCNVVIPLGFQSNYSCKLQLSIGSTCFCFWSRSSCCTCTTSTFQYIIGDSVEIWTKKIGAQSMSMLRGSNSIWYIMRH